MREIFVPKEIRKYKSMRFFETPEGSHVMIFPKCRIPAKYLVPENWDEAESKSNVGNMRQVRRITQLHNSSEIRDKAGKVTQLYAKSPERTFSQYALNFGGENPEHIWNNARTWGGGPDPNGIKLEGKFIERQVDWEARILLGLRKNKIRAEEPQAIVIHPNGQRELIVRGIREQPRFLTGKEMQEVKDGKRKLPPFNQIDMTRLRQRVRGIGFVPIDLGFSERDINDDGDMGDTRKNIIYDDEGNGHVTDVNRWRWAPHTDAYRKKLMDAVIKEIARRKETKK